jgi:rhodanese-like protein
MSQKLFAFCLLAALCVGAGVVAGPARARAAQGDATSRVTLAEFKALLASASPPYILDVRGVIDSKIKGAHHIPLTELETRLNEIPRDRAIVTYCA